MKNWDTKAARALKQLASPYALVLTGTPLENRLRELVSIVQFVDQHRLGPTWRFLERHQVVADTGQVVGYRHLDEVAASLAPVLIRRRKAEVLDQLPLAARRSTVCRSPHPNAPCTRRMRKRWRGSSPAGNSVTFCPMATRSA
ncbi:MAG: SNF2-related protein [Gammaproteobacteria bacterium]|nr:SNF2-related protein [Gammaproteobacteria bacterium]